MFYQDETDENFIPETTHTGEVASQNNLYVDCEAVVTPDDYSIAELDQIALEQHMRDVAKRTLYGDSILENFNQQTYQVNEFDLSTQQELKTLSNKSADFMNIP